MKTPEWLITADFDSIIPEDEILSELYKMLQSTNLVNDLEALKKDFENRQKKVSPYFNENLYFCITKSLSVRGFCAALINFPDQKKYCLSAWNDYSEENLNNLYELGEFLKIQNNK